jgi:hypothetical protein
MTSRIQNNRWLLAGLLALAAITLAIVFVLLRSEQDAEDPAPAMAEAPSIQLEVWALDDAQTVSVHVDPDRGPLWEHDYNSIELAPQSDALSYNAWTVEPADGRTRVVGTGTLGRAELSATWTFADGNPQVHLAVDIHGIPATRLAKPIAFTVPKIVGEQVDVAGERLLLWQPTADLKCKGGGDEPSFDLHTQHIVSFQNTPDISRWHYDNGASAQLVPVFDLSENHPDPQIAQTSAKSASAWLGRARTLIYGHSNPGDPRYGNGGLLGHGLGATIAVPPKWAEHPDIVELAGDLRGSRVELAPRGEAEHAALLGTRFALEPSCRTLVELSQKGVSAAIVDLVSSPEDAPETDAPTGFSGGTTSLVATATPVQLDGQLSTLLERALNTRTLDSLVRERGSFVFSAPFVATRNPLIGAAKEALLEPERDGHWTMTADLSEALANLELWREATPLLVTSVGRAASQASASRDVLHWWAPDGTLEVYNPGNKAISGYTLVVDGTVGAHLEGAAISSRQILLDAQRQATLLWWDLEPGVHTLRLSASDSELAAPTPVDWQITAP